MSKRHQHRRRRAYGPRQHEVRERRLRRAEPLERWIASIVEAGPADAGPGRRPLGVGPWFARDVEAAPLRAVD